MDPIMPEAVISLGGVPLAKYGTPGTMEVPDSIEGFLDDYDAVLLENHGALTYSDSLLNAYYKMESVEFYARLMYQHRCWAEQRSFRRRKWKSFMRPAGE